MNTSSHVSADPSGTLPASASIAANDLNKMHPSSSSSPAGPANHPNPDDSSKQPPQEQPPSTNTTDGSQKKRSAADAGLGSEEAVAKKGRIDEELDELAGEQDEDGGQGGGESSRGEQEKGKKPKKKKQSVAEKKRKADAMHLKRNLERRLQAEQRKQGVNQNIDGDDEQAGGFKVPAPEFEFDSRADIAAAEAAAMIDLDENKKAEEEVIERMAVEFLAEEAGREKADIEVIEEMQAHVEEDGDGHGGDSVLHDDDNDGQVMQGNKDDGGRHGSKDDDDFDFPFDQHILDKVFMATDAVEEEIRQAKPDDVRDIKAQGDLDGQAEGSGAGAVYFGGLGMMTPSKRSGKGDGSASREKGVKLYQSWMARGGINRLEGAARCRSCINLDNGVATGLSCEIPKELLISKAGDPTRVGCFVPKTGKAVACLACQMGHKSGCSLSNTSTKSKTVKVRQIELLDAVSRLDRVVSLYRPDNNDVDSISAKQAAKLALKFLGGELRQEEPPVPAYAMVEDKVLRQALRDVTPTDEDGEVMRKSANKGQRKKRAGA